MRIVKAQKPHYALLVDDSEDAPVVDAGDGDASIQLGNVVLWFDSRGDRESDPRVQAFRLGSVEARIFDEVEREKSTDAYREKAIQAQVLIDGETYDPLIHDFVEIEVRYTGDDPLDVAQAIRDAAQSDTDAARQKLLEQEEKRVEKREKQRTRLSNPPGPPDNPGPP